MKRTDLAILVLLIGSFFFSGCVIGPTTKELRENMEPAGIGVNVNLSDGHVTDGELLTVSSDEIAVLTTKGITLIPAEMTTSLTMEEPPGTIRPEAGQFSTDDVAKLRPMSRFPAGFPPGILDKLIDLHGTYDLVAGEGDSP